MGETSPSFQCYPRDLLAETDNLSDAAFGLYVRLLFKQWLNEGLPADFESDDAECMVDILPAGDVKERRLSWRRISKHFGPLPEFLPDGRVGQRRLEEIRAEQRRYRAMQADKSRKGVAARRRGGRDDGQLQLVPDQPAGQPTGTPPDQPAGEPADQPAGGARVNQRDDLGLTSATATASATAVAPPTPPAGGEGVNRAAMSEPMTFGLWFFDRGIELGAIPPHFVTDPGRMGFALRFREASTSLLGAYGVEEVKARSERLFERRIRRDADRLRAPATPELLARHWDWFLSDVVGRVARGIAAHDSRDIGGKEAVASIAAATESIES